jgi:hypothetical protein
MDAFNDKAKSRFLRQRATVGFWLALWWLRIRSHDNSCLSVYEYWMSDDYGE